MPKKLLFISSRPIYPITGGDQIRTAQQLELLLERFRVDVIYLTPNDKEERIRHFQPKVGKIYSFKSGRIRHYFQTLRFLFNRLPLQVNYYYDKRMVKKINSIIGNYDAVFCNNIRTAEYAIRTPITKYIDFVDAISMNYDKARKESKGIKRLIYSIDYKRCKDYEQRCLEAFDSCAIISDIDNQYIMSCRK